MAPLMIRPSVSHATDADASVTGPQSKTRHAEAWRITQRCASVGRTSRDIAAGETVYSAIARTIRAAHAAREDRVPHASSRATPIPASNAVISCTTIPNRAYDRNIGRVG